MRLSLHIAQGDARRAAGDKNASVDQCVAAGLRLGPIARKRTAVANMNSASAPGDASPSRGASETTHHRVMDHEKFTL
jgi:hypothetical protein